ncbi:MAG: IS110 family transposase, partial [Nitrososphaerota archaeon]|nr:IS110 family transposase [Nitrososphaerota archaeon]
MDLHKRYSEFAVMDIDGNLLKQGRIENGLDEMREFSESLPASTSMAIESSSTWYWAYKLLSERHNVVLSNPVRNKAIASAKVKTDKVDSIMLATLLRGNFLAESYVPPRETIDLRELVRHRANLVRERTRLKNWVHAYLLMNNIRIDAHPFTNDFVEELRRMEEPRVQSYLRLIDGLNEEIRGASNTIREKAGESEEARLLMTIPGISFYSALLITSEIGEIQRFEDSPSLVAYAGLAPSTHSSGGRTYHGPIMKSGSRYLRWIMGQCARANMRVEPQGTVAAFYA